MENTEKIKILECNILELKKQINLYKKYIKKLNQGKNINYVPSKYDYKEYQRSYYFNTLKQMRKEKNEQTKKENKINKYCVDNYFDDNFLININE